MTRDLRLYISDILDSIAKIEQYTQSGTEHTFLADPQVQDAVLRRLEIIGEAVKSIPEDFRDKYSGIPWRKIAGLKDVLIHEYFGVNMRRTWKVVKEDIPHLKNELQQVQNDLS